MFDVVGVSAAGLPRPVGGSGHEQLTIFHQVVSSLEGGAMIQGAK
ncbi:hypothetical protein [Musicola keenii]|nr:hypothetical protein [Musicola keenii]